MVRMSLSKIRKTTPKLMMLTKNVHTLLPRELRDMIYSYLLEPHDILQISTCSTPRLDRFPYAYGYEPPEYKTHRSSTTPKPPPYADSNKAYPGFVVEILETVYELHPELWVDMPSAIPAFLATDFWGAGCTPTTARLRRVHISGGLDSDTTNAINLASLSTDLATLLGCSWRRTMTFDIVFRTELGVSVFERKRIPHLARTMHAASQIVQAFIPEAEKRGAHVHFLMLTKYKMYAYGTGGQCAEGNGGTGMLETVEQWEEDLGLMYGVLNIGGFWDWEATYASERKRVGNRAVLKRVVARGLGWVCCN